MATLQEMLLTQEVAPQVVADCKALVTGELDNKGGLSGTAVKAAYKVVTTVAPGYYENVIWSMLPRMVYQLEPFWADFLAYGGAEFGDYLVKNSDAVSAALLSVTDEMARASSRAAIVKAYQMVRGSAGKNITAALPALGAMVQNYA